MSNLNRHPVRRAAVGVLAGTLAFTGAALGVGISPANAFENVELERLGGVDRYETAEIIATDTFAPNSVPTVVLASGAPRNFPDALTGNYLAGAVQGPILLTPTAALSQFTIDGLDELNPDNVVIVGETDAVSANVETQLEGLGYNVERIGGPDRYDTAAAVAEFVGGGADGTVGEVNSERVAILGNGQNFPDILAAGPLSYDRLLPITITPSFSSTVHADTLATLKSLTIDRVVIVGGTTAVQPGVETQLEAEGFEVTRLHDPVERQRFSTAVEIAEYAFDNLGFDRDHVNLARSDDFADALAGGPHGGEDRSPIVITTPTALHPTTEAFLTEICATVAGGHVFGGPVAISEATKAAAEDALSCPPLPDTTAPLLVDATVASDAAVATDSAVASDVAGATDTASAGDIWELTFNEPLATDTAGVQIAVADGDDPADTATVECGADVDATDDVIAATCEVDGNVLTVTLLEDIPSGDALDYPLTITSITGLTDAAGNEVDVTDAGSDTTLENDTA